MKMKKKIKTKFKVIIGLLVVIFIISTSFVVFYYVDSFKSKQDISGLIEQIDRGETILIPSDNVEEQEKAWAEIEKRKLESYQKLYEQNNDLVGWIQIEDTTIDFPVMQKKSVKNYYLYKNFEKKYSKGGLPYVQEDCDVFTPTDNVIIHGHNLSDGSMFNALLKFKNKDFYNEHSIINFDTIEECHQYKIIAVLTIAVNTGNDKFPFYDFINASSAKEFDAYIKACKKYSRFDTGVTAEYGDKLITIATCDFSIKNGRLVIVAKRIK